MKLSLAFLTAAAPVLVSGKRLKKTARAKNLAETDLSNVNIDAATKTGNNLLSKARRLDGGDEFTWIAGYSLKFHSCTESEDYYGGQGNGNNNYNGQYYNNQAYGNAQNGNGRKLEQNYNYYNGGNQEKGMYQQKLVHFRLCPSDSCWRCKNGAEYVVTLNDFVDAALESQMSALEYRCEQVRENCYCQNANSEEQCLYSCFKNAGLAECADNMYEGEFDVQEAVECTQLEVDDEDAVKNYVYSNTNEAFWKDVYWMQQGGNNGGEVGEIEGDLYVGPYCSKNGKKIHLGVFMEETCSYPAPDGIYEALHYGEHLPYAKKSIVDNKCISCVAPKEANYDNYWEAQQQEDAVAEFCYDLYALAGKCEEGLEGYYPYRDVTGCTFIHTLKSAHGLSLGGTNVPARVFAGIFAATTALLAAVSVYLFRKDKRRTINLADESILS